MALQRKDIMLVTNKERAFKLIAMKTEWSSHRKAAERSAWKKKNEPDTIKKCPNRGKRYKKTTNDNDAKNITITPPPLPIPGKTPPTTIIMEKTTQEDDDRCQKCQLSSNGYDFPCAHPICYPCFIKYFTENNGHIQCLVCSTEYDFQDNLVDEND